MLHSPWKCRSGWETKQYAYTSASAVWCYTSAVYYQCFCFFHRSKEIGGTPAGLLAPPNAPQLVQPSATQLRTICLLSQLKQWKIWKYYNNCHMESPKQYSLVLVTRKTDSIQHGGVTTVANMWCHLQNIFGFTSNFECKDVLIGLGPFCIRWKRCFQPEKYMQSTDLIETVACCWINTLSNV